MKNSKLVTQRGFTLIEVIIAGAVIAFGMVLVTGSIVSAYNHNKMTEARGAAADFNNNMIEIMRVFSLDEILTHTLDADDADSGAVLIEGMGMVLVEFFAVLPPAVPGGEPTYFHIGVDNPAGVVDPPNPIEVQMVLRRAPVDGGEPGAELYKTSAMIQH